MYKKFPKRRVSWLLGSVFYATFDRKSCAKLPARFFMPLFSATFFLPLLVGQKPLPPRVISSVANESERNREICLRNCNHEFFYAAFGRSKAAQNPPHENLGGSVHSPRGEGRFARLKQSNGLLRLSRGRVPLFFRLDFKCGFIERLAAFRFLLNYALSCHFERSREI